MQLFRCHHCNWVLYAAKGEIDAEAICPKCRRVNYPSRTDQGFGLRGKDFQSKSIDHMCYLCGKLLLRTIGIGLVELECYVCSKKGSKYRLVFDTDLMRKGLFKYPVNENPVLKKMRESLAR